MPPWTLTVFGMTIAWLPVRAPFNHSEKSSGYCGNRLDETKGSMLLATLPHISNPDWDQATYKLVNSGLWVRSNNLWMILATLTSMFSYVSSRCWHKYLFHRLPVLASENWVVRMGGQCWNLAKVFLQLLLEFLLCTTVMTSNTSIHALQFQRCYVYMFSSSLLLFHLQVSSSSHLCCM